MWNRVRRRMRRSGSETTSTINNDDDDDDDRQTATSNATTAETETGNETPADQSAAVTTTSVAVAQSIMEEEHDRNDHDRRRDSSSSSSCPQGQGITDCHVGQQRHTGTTPPTVTSVDVTITKHDTKKERRHKYNQWFIQNKCAMKVSQGDVVLVDRNRNRINKDGENGDGENGESGINGNNSDNDDCSYGHDDYEDDYEEDVHERRRLVIPRWSKKQSLLSTQNRSSLPLTISSSARALMMVIEQQGNECDEKTEREEEDDDNAEEDEQENFDDEDDDDDDDESDEKNNENDDEAVAQMNSCKNNNGDNNNSAVATSDVRLDSTIGSSLEEPESSSLQKSAVLQQPRHQHHDSSCNDRCSSATAPCSFSVPDRCLICLESYHIGDSVVWSSNVECDHVFHRHCLIKYFDKLQRRRGETPCPCCRQSYCPTLTIEVRARKTNNRRRRSRSSVLSFQRFVWNTLSLTGSTNGNRSNRSGIDNGNNENRNDDDNDSCVDNDQFDENRSGGGNDVNSHHRERRQQQRFSFAPSPTMIMSSIRRTMIQQSSFGMMRFTANTTRPPRRITSVPTNG